jgi:hypothetical protein
MSAIKQAVLYDPGDVRFEEVAEGYRAMDERRAIKVLLRV